MGFRFFRRVRLLPGVGLNFSRSGVSLSLGGRGVGLTLGQKPTFRVGLPGTGLSYVISARALADSLKRTFRRPPSLEGWKQQMHVAFQRSRSSRWSEARDHLRALLASGASIPWRSDLTDYREQLQLSPFITAELGLDKYSALLVLSEAEQHLGHLDHALETLDTLLKYDSYDPVTTMARLDVLAVLASGTPSYANRLLSSIEHGAPVIGVDSSLYYKALAYTCAGRFDAAINLLEVKCGAGTTSKSRPLLELLQTCYQQAGRLAEARRTRDRITSL